MPNATQRGTSAYGGLIANAESKDANLHRGSQSVVSMTAMRQSLLLGSIAAARLTRCVPLSVTGWVRAIPTRTAGSAKEVRVADFSKPTYGCDRPRAVRAISTRPNDTWLTIVAYRSFYDVPRLILAMDDAARFWVMDCRFLDDIEDYSDSYDLFSIGRRDDRAVVLDDYLNHAIGDYVRSVKVSDVEFDATHRHRLRLLDSERER